MLGTAEKGTRAPRHEATRQRIVDEAWRQVRQHGLTGLSLRRLGSSVGMRAPSLYSYFVSKSSIYDVMFAQGWAECIAEVTPCVTASDRRGVLRQLARSFAAFSLRDPIRYQLMCQRVIPGYVPSPEAYAEAVEALELTVSRLRAVGIDEPGDVDLWTALLTGLIDQQIANDLGGERWLRLIDDAVDMYVDRIDRRTK